MTTFLSSSLTCSAKRRADRILDFWQIRLMRPETTLLITPGRAKMKTPSWNQEEVPMANQNSPSLYERLGGVYSIATVVDDFVDRIMVDPRLNAKPEGRRGSSSSFP